MENRNAIVSFVEGSRPDDHVKIEPQPVDDDPEGSLAPSPSPSPRASDRLPLVSCICPTYNRPPSHQHLLEEAIESFLRQDYPNKELIVINDCPGQELVCDAPGVRVVNVPERFPTLGEKRNAGVRLSRGELIAPWDDDDISLPWRLSLSVARLGDAAYFNARRYWFLDGAGLHGDHAMGVGHKCSLFTRAAFEAVGGYPTSSGAEDMEMDAALVTRMPRVLDVLSGDAELMRREWFYIYRWGVSPSHLTARVPHDAFYRELATWPVQPGRFELHPRWQQDYAADTHALLEAPEVAEAR